MAHKKLHPAIKRITFHREPRPHKDRFRVLVDFGDRVWDKRFHTLTEAKWSRQWALESGAIRATILEDRRQ